MTTPGGARMGADYEPMTPVQAEAAIQRTTRQVHSATIEYRKAGLNLVDAKRDYLIARTKAEFHPDCPKVSRGEVTVGDRDAWINKQIQAEAMGLYAAEIMRENAIETLRTARVEHQGAMSLNASAREAYRNYMVDA